MKEALKNLQGDEGLANPSPTPDPGLETKVNNTYPVSCSSVMQEHKLMKMKSPMTSPKLREFKET
jgi:hypothetical protein